MARWRLLWMVSVVTAAQLAGTLLFSSGFLLSRTQVGLVSSANNPVQGTYRSLAGSQIAQPYDKVVMLILDALRLDFVQTQSYSAPDGAHVSAMRQSRAKLQAMGSAALLAAFPADPPTTTMQRVKALLTGSLPTFLDVGSVFAGGTVTEDNLIAQALAAGKRVAVVGDDTWEQLFPAALNYSKSFPSFNVKDLHTVDNGVMQELMGEGLLHSDGWDVLVGHMLGMDHAGHTFGVDSAQMLAKVQENDAQVVEVIEALIAEGGTGSRHEHTLFLAFGDHGQTLTGDHGGGSQEELDSALLAVDIGAAAALRASSTTADTNATNECAQSASQNAEADDSGACSANSAQQRADEARALRATSLPVVPQLDFAASISYLLGLAIPAESVGKVHPALWSLAGARQFTSGNCLPEDPGTLAQQDHANGTSAVPEHMQPCRQAYAHAVSCSARQVHSYLLAYADKARLPHATLAALTATFTNLQQTNASADHHIAAALHYHALAAAAARTRWTQFKPVRIVSGLALLTLAVLVPLAACCSTASHRCWLSSLLLRVSSLHYEKQLAPAPSAQAISVPLAVMIALVVVRSAVPFSNSLVLGELQLTTFVVASGVCACAGAALSRLVCAQRCAYARHAAQSNLKRHQPMSEPMTPWEQLRWSGHILADVCKYLPCDSSVSSPIAAAPCLEPKGQTWQRARVRPGPVWCLAALAAGALLLPSMGGLRWLLWAVPAGLVCTNLWVIWRFLRRIRPFQAYSAAATEELGPRKLARKVVQLASLVGIALGASYCLLQYGGIDRIGANPFDKSAGTAQRSNASATVNAMQPWLLTLPMIVACSMLAGQLESCVQRITARPATLQRFGVHVPWRRTVGDVLLWLFSPQGLLRRVLFPHTLLALVMDADCEDDREQAKEAEAHHGSYDRAPVTGIVDLSIVSYLNRRRRGLRMRREWVRSASVGDKAVERSLRWRTSLLLACLAGIATALSVCSMLWPLHAHADLQLGRGRCLGDLSLRQLWNETLYWRDLTPGTWRLVALASRGATLLLLRSTQAVSLWCYVALTLPHSLARRLTSIALRLCFGSQYSSMADVESVLPGAGPIVAALLRWDAVAASIHTPFTDTLLRLLLPRCILAAAAVALALTPLACAAAYAVRNAWERDFITQRIFEHAAAQSPLMFQAEDQKEIPECQDSATNAQHDFAADNGGRVTATAQFAAYAAVSAMVPVWLVVLPPGRAAVASAALALVVSVLGILRMHWWAERAVSELASSDGAREGEDNRALAARASEQGRTGTGTWQSASNLAASTGCHAAAQQGVNASEGTLLAALLFSLLPAQLFLGSGHFCEFAGLQWTAAFAGFDQSESALAAVRSGTLVAINTFAPHAICTVLLLAIASAELHSTMHAYNAGAADGHAWQRPDRTPKPNAHNISGAMNIGHRKCSTMHAAMLWLTGMLSMHRDDRVCIKAACDGKAEPAVSASLRQRHVSEWVHAVFSTVLLVRLSAAGLDLFCASLNAFIQRRHLMIWALFAPKWMFEVCFWGVAACALLFCAVIADLCFEASRPKCERRGELSESTA